MSTRAPARPVVAAAAVLAGLATFALAGCQQTDEKPSAGSNTSTAKPTVAEETESSPPATPTEPEVTSSTSPAPTSPAPTEETAGATGLRGRLLSAAELPGFNQEFRWTVASTRSHEPSEPFGTCQRFDMSAIGATAVAVRRYRPAVAGSTDQAGQLVAEFPDSTTARRAFEVLKSWRAKCADRLSRYDRSEVGKLENVGVGGGTGGWYLLTYGPVPGDPESQYFDAQGMAVVGSRIAMVEMILGGQDYNYDAGKEPAVVAVQRAAAKLS